MEKYYYCYQTVIGEITISSINDEIVGCCFGKKEDGIYQETPAIQEAYRQLEEYLCGKRISFDLKYRFISGTAFQQRVWEALLKIPYGSVATYQDIAEAVGSSKAYRAVGNANHVNPIVIFVPCHRVVCTSLKLGGYGGGIEIKRFLLDLERKNKV